VDAYVTQGMAAWPDQPALGIAVVKDGTPVLARGYGVKVQGKPARADEHTLFAIASNTKNVTAAALAILVDEGKVKWDAPIRTYLPGFTLSDPYIGEHITVRDTLSHRAGFGLGAGDLLFWPNSDRTRAEVLAQAAFVPIEDGFRARYHYCNLMFVVAGAVIEAVSGLSWEDFIQTRILDKVGMSETVPLARLADPARSALPHGRVGPPLRYQGAMTPIAKSIVEVWNWDSAAAAGGICTTPTDWAKWIAVRLNDGLLPDGTRLYSEAAAREMYRPTSSSASSPGPTAELPNRAIASTYAMGLQVQDYRGERLISHGGGSPGGISATVLIPGRKTGFSIFSNAEESFLLRALRSGIADLCMGKVDVDWIADSKTAGGRGQCEIHRRRRRDRRQTGGWRAAVHAAGRLCRHLARPLVRRHRHCAQDRGPRPKSQDRPVAELHPHPALQGWLEPYDGETFRTRFPDKREEDAFVTFAIQTAKPATATVKGVSPDIDFSYDYQDLRLTRV
jgi:CubicO group peptidase (beta-lactamase class C family)